MVTGFFIAGPRGIFIALIIATLCNLFAWWNSDKMVLSTYHAHRVHENNAPQLFHMVRRMCNKANIPMPKIYIIENKQPNAFATGRNPENAAIAITSGLIKLLSKEELAGVIAHELAHIQNRDTLIMTLTATLAGAISWLMNFLYILPAFQSRNEEGRHNNPLIIMIVSILAPLLATIVQMAISRNREYEADKTGAFICGNPIWLASALQKIEDYIQNHHTINQDAEDNPATAHIFIINPLLGKGLSHLFNTHPTTSQRIIALKKLAHH